MKTTPKNMQMMERAVAVLAGCLVAPAQAAVIRVPDDQPTIQAAIDVAENGDEIVLADLTFMGEGNKNVSFGGKTLLLGSESENREVCIIDCENDGRFATIGAGDAVVVQSITVMNGDAGGENGGAVVMGPVGSASFIDCEFQECVAARGGAVYSGGADVTIDGSSFTGNSSLAGGGGGALRVLGGALLTCTGTSFDGNSAGAGGGGVLLNLVDPASRISGCQFTNNEARDGGGGGLGSTNNFAEISNCLFQGNVAGFAGGILFRGNHTTQVENVVFLDNTATFGGGVEVEPGNSVEFVNCLFARNMAIAPVDGEDHPIGGGLCVFGTAGTATLINCTFSDNSSEEFGGAVAASTDGDLQLVNCVLWGNEALLGSEIRIGYPGDKDPGTVTVSYSDVAGGEAGVSNDGGTLNWGDGNIDCDPLFVDPENDDYRLSSGSCAIDAGNNDVVSGDEDLGGDPRFQDDPDTTDTGNGRPPLVDMGAYEYQGGFCPADLDGSGAVDFGDILSILTAWGPCEDGCPQDLDDSGAVDFGDILVVLMSWGPCVCSACRLTDDCLVAPLGSEGSHFFSTEQATDDGPDLPEACDEGRGLLFRRDVWLRYVASCDGLATARTCDSTFDTRLAVYELSELECPGAFLACSDDACGENGTRSEVSFPVESGRSYLIRIGGRFAVGEGSLVIECAE